MTTVNKIMLDVRALMDELTKKGVLIPEISVADLIAKGVRLVDMAQKELFAIGNLNAKFEVTQKNPDNLIGRFSGFNILEYTGEEDIIVGGQAARSYYFEADDEGTCIIEEQESGVWQPLITINLQPSVEMLPYKGLITPTTQGNLIRYRFTGSTYFKVTNYALFKEPFKADRIPSHRPWIKYEMPSDFRRVDVVVEEFPERQYHHSASYKWEGFNELWVNYFYVGTIRVNYKPVPKTITSESDILEIDDITANAITYYVGAKLSAHDYPELTSYFEQRYNEIAMMANVKQPGQEMLIKDVYGVMYGNL
jgi:hypothetical protein